MLRVGCHPCGCIAGDIRFPYTAMMRTIEGEPPAEVVWFFARPDAKFLPRNHSFRSGMYYLDRWGENTGIGEQHPRDPSRLCKEYPYSGTQQPPAFYLGQNYCGSDEVWVRGAIPGVDPIFSTDVNGVSTCCQRPQMIGSGGDRDGGTGMIECQDFPIWATRLLGCGGDADGGSALTSYGDVTEAEGGDADGGEAPEGPGPSYRSSTLTGVLGSGHTNSKPAGTAAGDLLIIIDVVNLNGVTLTTPTGFTALVSGDDPSGVNSYKVSWRIATGSEGASFPSTGGGPGLLRCSLVVAIKNSAAPTVFGVGGGNGVDVASASIVSTTPASLAIALFFVADVFDGSETPPPAMTFRAQATGTADAQVYTQLAVATGDTVQGTIEDMPFAVDWATVIVFAPSAGLS